MIPVPTESALELLQEKNSLLDSFLTLTREEMAKVKRKKFDSLESFYQHRDKILRLVQVISEHFTQAQPPQCPVERQQLDVLEEEADRLISRILEVDLEMISLIDHEKNLVIRELQSVHANRKILKAYRSGL